MIGGLAEIFVGVLVLIDGAAVALNYRGRAEYPLQAHIAFGREHPRLYRVLTLGRRIPDGGSIPGGAGVGTFRVAWALFAALFGGVLLVAGIVALL